MRNKKLLALGMASLMMVSSISTVFADEASVASSAQYLLMTLLTLHQLLAQSKVMVEL